METSNPPSQARLACQLSLVAAAYWIAGRLALLLALPPGYASPVWPAAGVALGAALVFGRKALPAVAAGSFFVNADTWASQAPERLGVSLLTAATIATGAALQAWAGAALIRRFIARPFLLATGRDVLGFQSLGGPVSCVVNATLSIATLRAVGALPASETAFHWWTWWVGDAMGAITVGPLVTLWLGREASVTLRRRLLVTVPTALTLAGVIALFVVTSQREETRLRLEFERQADELMDRVQASLSRDMAVIQAARAFFGASQSVSEEEFGRFGRDLVLQSGTIFLLEWAPSVASAEREAWERANCEILEVGEGGRLARASSRAAYAPVRFAEPRERASGLLGFDLTSERIRRAALERAQATGELAASEPILLVQDAASGALLAAPAATTGEGAQRGFLVMVVKPGVLVEKSTAGVHRAGLSLRLRDAGIPDRAGQLYGDVAGEGFAVFRRDHDLPVGGRIWRLECALDRAALAARRPLQAWSVLAGGLLFSALLGAFLLTLSGRAAAIESLVRERTAELQAANAALRASGAELATARDAADSANRAKSEFLANMSHEIRTPMNGVLGALELAIDAPPGPEKGELLRMARTSAEDLLGLLNSILDLSKIEAGRFSLDPVEFGLREMVEDTIKLLAPRAMQKRLELACEVAPDVPGRAVGDALRLRQVVMNLVSNALKFTERGRVAVKVSSTRGQGSDLTLTVAVSDTGIGIPREKLRAIFEPFTQADPSTTRRFGGTGLGLTICRSLVEMMSGDIEVTSEVGKGSTFRFNVLLQVADPAGRAATSPRAPEPGQEAGPSSAGASLAAPASLRLLVAEDNVVNQTVIRKMLEALGHSVTIVANGRDAVTAAAAGRWDAIFLDLQMPEMDGLAAAAAIRAAEAGKARALVIAITAHAGDDDRARCLAAGMDDFVSKPISQHELQRALGAAAPPPSPAARKAAAAEFGAEEALARLGGDREMLVEVVRLFVADLPGRIRSLRDAAAAGDAEALMRSAHQLYGSAGMLSAWRLAQVAREAESCASSGDLPGASAAVRRLDGEAAALVAAVGSLISEGNS